MWERVEKGGGKNCGKIEALGGLVLGRRGYRRLGLLGQGAFSRVYCVEDEESWGVLACKVSENVRILEKEAQVMAVLGHKLFPAYFDFWQEAGLGFLLSEYVAGRSLEEMLARRGRFGARQTACVGIALAEGLGYLHRREEAFLFRDVKPANIMVCQDGRVKLIDFGCVCSLRGMVSSRAGSPGFAAPEQLSGEGELSPACDVYGLGRTLWDMLGGSEGERRDVRKREGMGAWGRYPGQNSRFLQRDRQEARDRRRLKRILEACTREDSSRRIPDMAGVEAELRKLWTSGSNWYR